MDERIRNFGENMLSRIAMVSNEKGLTKSQQLKHIKNYMKEGIKRLKEFPEYQQLHLKTNEELIELGACWYDKPHKLLLLTPFLYNLIDDGVELVSIMDDEACREKSTIDWNKPTRHVKGKDNNIDFDIRMGMLAWGFLRNDEIEKESE